MGGSLIWWQSLEVLFPQSQQDIKDFSKYSIGYKNMAYYTNIESSCYIPRINIMYVNLPQ